MTIIYNIAARKPFVKAISKITGEPSKYMFTPTYSYQIGDFTVTREGNLEFDDMTDSELVEKVIEELDNLGYHAEPAVGESDTVEVEAEPEIETPVAEAEMETPAADEADIDDKPENEATVAKAESNSDNHIAEAADDNNALSNSDEQADIEPDVDNAIGNRCVNDNLGGNAAANDNMNGTADHNGIEVGHTVDTETPATEAASEVDHFTVQFARDSFTTLQLTNLQKIVAAKAPLLKQAIGCDELPIIITDDRVSFPWFAGNLDADTCIAYTTLVSAICTMAKAAKWVTAKEKDVENPKYAFRCFLLRLGFIGDEYKRSRKILMKNFTGSGAFKRVKSAEAVEEAEA